ncbi:MAG: glycine cleavage T C-terminal barrel domain-containing protein [Planctomycetota bacterium]|nr:glycine cleavage T C-terminal barrel domain-containing protein [Planctomycetota bacterium]
MSTLHPIATDPGYLALTDGVGLVNLSDRTQLELTGEDRASFLHNFCTNAVRNRPVGQGCEAFITSAKGQIVGHVYIFCGERSIILETVPDQAEALTAHLDRYIIREKVEIHDRTAEWGEVLLAGPQAAELLESLAVAAPVAEYSHTESMLASEPVFVRRVNLVGPECFMIAVERQQLEWLIQSLITAGVIPASRQAFETARVETGTPLFGIDITSKNLPQEVNRDASAISFTKGCYLGQETVARIDALGHVNRLLVSVVFEGTEVPQAGTELFSASAAEGEPAAIGTVTSAVFSPRFKAPLALAYVRRGQNDVGSQLEWSGGRGKVVRLPL